MAKALEIKRIDLLVHPFFYRPKSKKQRYGKPEAEFLLDLWKEHVDEVARDPNRLLFITTQGLGASKKAGGNGSQREMRIKMVKQLVDYAESRLGERFARFAEPGHLYVTIKTSGNGKGKNSGRVFTTFREYKKESGLKIDPKSLKTRGLGEYTNQCVVEYLTWMNKSVGLKNIIPYRNSQSTILARKSVSGSKKAYPMPWELKDLNKTTAGREMLRKWMQKYIREKREKANERARRYKKKEFEPRPHLMKKKKP